MKVSIQFIRYSPLAVSAIFIVALNSYAQSSIIESFAEYGTQQRAAGYLDMPEEGRQLASDRAAKIKDQLLADPDETVTEMLSFFEKEETRTSDRVDILNFLSKENIGIDRFMPLVRDQIKNADLNKDPAPLLSASVSFIKENGNIADVELLDRLAEHINPGISRQSSLTAEHLKKSATIETVETVSSKGPQNLSPHSSQSSKGEATPIAQSPQARPAILIGIIALCICLIFVLFYRSRRNAG